MKHLVILLVFFIAIPSIAQNKKQNVILLEKSTTLFNFITKKDKLIEADSDLIAGIQDLCWTQDGRYIYFSGMWHKSDYSDYTPEKWSIYRYSLEIQTTKLFIDSAFNVAVDRTGNKIAVGRLVNGNRDIYVTDSIGESFKRITSHPAEDFAPSWSPDGKQIVFNSKRDGKRPEIYIVNADSTDLKRLTFGVPSGSYNPAWSPDGKFVVYYFESGDRKDQIYLMKPDGSESINISNDTLNNYFPGWINKNTIVYTQDLPDKKSSKIIILTSDGKEKKPLPDIVSYYARFSKDEKMIAYIDGYENCIKIISTDGQLKNIITFSK